jgi:hypothetical protein
VAVNPDFRDLFAALNAAAARDLLDVETLERA